MEKLEMLIPTAEDRTKIWENLQERKDEPVGFISACLCACVCGACTACLCSCESTPSCRYPDGE
jgi:hypothetical protein